jgi:hypothetical protein
VWQSLSPVYFAPPLSARFNGGKTWKLEAEFFLERIQATVEFVVGSYQARKKFISKIKIIASLKRFLTPRHLAVVVRSLQNPSLLPTF